MNRVLVTALALMLATPAWATSPPATEEEKTVYAVGLAVARSLSAFQLSPQELELVKLGMKDAVEKKKTAVDLDAYQPKIQQLVRERRKLQGEKMAASGKEYLDKAASEQGAIKTASGFVFHPLAEGKGASPKSTDVVKVNYRGTLIDGREFDSSYKRGRALEFRLDNVIKCWTEGVQMMKPGGKAKLVCPPQLAYGDTGAGEMILPGATLAFEVELLEVKPETVPPTGKAASAQPPAPAHK